MNYKNSNLYPAADAVLKAAAAYGTDDGFSVTLPVPETLSALNALGHLNGIEQDLRSILRHAAGNQYTEIILVEA